MTTAPKNVAFNPLPWAMTSKGFDFDTMPSIEVILQEIRESGFGAVHAEIPIGRDESSYLLALRESGLNPAPGYFQANFANKEELDDILGRAAAAARFHKKMGLDRIFVADQFGSDPSRLKQPAIGINMDSARLVQIADSLNQVADVMALEGVKACLHPHVGTMIETGPEIEFILEETNKNLLFGPDTGHLQWAGVDPAEMIKRHRERVGAVHIKDLHSAVAENPGSNDYLEMMLDHIWTEPGRGDVDFDRVFDALGGFDGWFVIEVDCTDLDSPFSSAKESAKWAASRVQRFGNK